MIDEDEYPFVAELIDLTHVVISGMKSNPDKKQLIDVLGIIGNMNRPNLIALDEVLKEMAGA